MLSTPGTRNSMHEKNNAPSYTYDVPNNRQKLMIWVVLVVDNTISGPYFFNQNVTGNSCPDMINQFVVPQGMDNFKIDPSRGGGRMEHLPIMLVWSGSGYSNFFQTELWDWVMPLN